MAIVDNAIKKIDRLPRGFIFTYRDLLLEVDKKDALLKALNRLEKNGLINKLSKGKYYKPVLTPFGVLKPSIGQVVKDLLFENGKIVGYLTGYSIYNHLGLTTQVSHVIQIGKNQIRPKFKRERYTIAFIYQKNNITKQNIPLLQVLDSIRYVKKIPDANMKNICMRFLEIISLLSDDDKNTLMQLSLKYPPATRAFLGAMLEELKETNLVLVLKKSLNPISQYKIEGVNGILRNAINWNIK